MNEIDVCILREMKTIIGMQRVKCDVIWENPAYGGTKIPGSGQTPRVLRGVRAEPQLLGTYEHLQKTFFSLSAQFKHNL